MEQNRTKIKSNPIERLVFDSVWQSNKMEHLFCYFELIEQTKSNKIEPSRCDFIRTVSLDDGN